MQRRLLGARAHCAWLAMALVSAGCAPAVSKSPRFTEQTAAQGKATFGGSKSSNASSSAMPSAVPLPPSETDIAVAALAEAAEACPFDPKRGFTTECDAVDRWEAEGDLFANGKGDSSLVRLLEQGSDRARALAASKLAAEGSTFQNDPAMATRVVSMATRETVDAVGADLGHAVAAIDLSATKTEASVLKLLTSKANRALTISLLEELTTHNEPTRAIDEVIAHEANDERPDVRQAAILGLALSDDQIACPTWEKALSDAEPAVALAAAHLIASTEHCDLLVDSVLSFIAAGQRKGAFTEPVVASTLAELCDSDGATKPQRFSAAALAEGFALPDLPVGLREEALRAALVCSPDESRFVKRYTTDPNEYLRRMAKDLLKEHHTKHRRAVR